ncbi:hypothetical protein POTOM_011303 [Populus tomentosa]|uniref:YTH domain-containing family protein n=1 Tax=Populus tomentosa TaxID=118781 RepID=A0A8X8A2R4_POPTO|nr:hypothetical protein POTOM_011303 [Populus tomentosa]
MATETKLGQRLESSPVVAKPVDNNVGSGIDGLPSDSTPTISASGNGVSDTKVNGSAVSITKMEADQEPNAASSYSYQYPAKVWSMSMNISGFLSIGYSGSSTQLDDQVYYQVDGSQTGMQSDNGSMVYYWPSYPYASGTVVGVDGQSVAQQPYFSSSGYLQHPVSYGLEAMPCYSWDSAYVSDVSNGNAVFENGKGDSGSTAFAQSNGFNSTKSNGNIGSKISKPMYTQLVRPMTKVSPSGSDFSAGLFKGYQPMGKFPPFTCQKPGPFPHNGPLNYRQNGRMWTGNYRNKSRDRFDKNYDFENQTELTRGPRASNKNAPLDSLVNKNASLDSSIVLKQGLEMLNIFKSYSAKTSLLDDFNFYEKREKSLNTKRGNKPATLQMEIFKNGDFAFCNIVHSSAAQKHTTAEEGISEDDSRIKKTTNPSSLINLTKNLSLSGHIQKSNPIKKPIGNSDPPVPSP